MANSRFFVVVGSQVLDSEATVCMMTSSRVYLFHDWIVTRFASKAFLKSCGERQLTNIFYQ